MIHANQKKTWVYNLEEEWEKLWTVEKAVAKVYGLTAEDVLLIMDDFPIFARKRPEFFAYLMDHIKKWKAEG